MRKNTLPAFPSSAKIHPIKSEVSTNIHQLYVVPTQKPTPNTHRLREGELILYKRERSDVWQARFKLFDRKWHSISTKHHNLEFASRAACEIYDEARFRERMGVSYTRRKFDAIAKETLKELQDEIDAGIKAMTNKDYISLACIWLSANNANRIVCPLMRIAARYLFIAVFMWPLRRGGSQYISRRKQILLHYIF